MAGGADRGQPQRKRAMRPTENEAPGHCSGEGARTILSANREISIPRSFALAQRGRLPAFGRAIRANLLAGKRPRIGGGCVCIVTDWTIRTPLAQMVCEPSEPVASWNLSFLAGVEVLLLTRATHAAYGQALRDAVLNVGSPLVSLHVVPKVDYAR
jgi:hypothetical protein